MKKILFNDRFSLTEAVLSGRKTQTRRICKHDRPDETYDIAFPIFEDRDFDDEGNPISPLYGAFCWRNEAGDCTEWNIPKYKVGEIVAVAQPYVKIASATTTWLTEEWEPKPEFEAGWTNKMLVRSDLMPNRIRITNVRVERLNEISEDDCLREGIIKGQVGSEDMHFMEAYYAPNVPLEPHVLPEGAYAALIDRISGKGTWQSNPYVFVYDFELVK